MPLDPAPFDLPPLATPDDIAALDARLVEVEGETADLGTRMATVEDDVANLQSSGSTSTVDWSLLGLAPLDSFAGATDVEKWDAALAQLATEPFGRTLVFPARTVDLRSASVKPLPTGFRWSGPLGSRAREFKTTNKVLLPAAGLFSLDTSAQDHAIRGLSFEGGSLLTPLATDDSQGHWTDLDITECGFDACSTTLAGSFLRLNLQALYVNNASSTPLKIGGSDCELFTSGTTYVSGSIPSQTPYIDTTGLGNSKIGKAYVTPQVGYALRVGNGRNALQFFGFVSDCTGRSAANSPQGAAIKIFNGEGVTFFGGKVFNANAASLDPGDIMVTGGHDHVFYGMQFQKTAGGYTAPNTSKAAIYTEVPISVLSPISVGGRPKILQQAAPGLIRCDDPTWQIVTQAA